MTSGRVQKVYDEGLRPSVASAFKQRRTETALGSARLDRSVRDRWKKILNHRLPFARNKHQAVLRRIDDLVAIAEQAADQRHIIVNLPGACDDLRRTAIDIHDVVAFARSTHRLSIFQLELLQSGPLLDHSAVTGMTALGGKAEDGDGGMPSRYACCSRTVAWVSSSNRAMCCSVKCGVSRLRRYSGETALPYKN